MKILVTGCAGMIGSYLTSKYTFEHGSRFTGDKLNFKDHISFVKLLQEHYHTVGFSSVENLNKYFNFDVGFNEYFDHIKYYSQFRNFGFNRKYNLLNILRINNVCLFNRISSPT